MMHSTITWESSNPPSFSSATDPVRANKEAYTPSSKSQGILRKIGSYFFSFFSFFSSSESAAAVRTAHKEETKNIRQRYGAAFKELFLKNFSFKVFWRNSSGDNSSSIDPSLKEVNSEIDKQKAITKESFSKWERLSHSSSIDMNIPRATAHERYLIEKQKLKNLEEQRNTIIENLVGSISSRTSSFIRPSKIVLTADKKGNPTQEEVEQHYEEYDVYGHQGARKQEIEDYNLSFGASSRQSVDILDDISTRPSSEITN